MVRYVPILDNKFIGTISNKHAVESVQEIQSYLTEELANLSHESSLSINVRTLRKECTQFIDNVEPLLNDESNYRQLSVEKEYLDHKFNDALWELKKKAGECVKNLATAYDLAVDGDLYYFIISEIDKTSLTWRYRSPQ